MQPSQPNKKQNSFVEKSELRELIIEMREGFKLIDQRFEAIDKRFEDINKRFEDQKEFNKSYFEILNKRLDDINNNFSFFRWFLTIFMSVIFSIISIYFYYIQNQNQKIYTEILNLIKQTKMESQQVK